MTQPTMRTQDPALSGTDLHLSYGDNKVLDGVNFSIGTGQVKAIVGASGSGKSTLLRVLALLETPEQGEVALKGKILGVRSRSGEGTRPARERELAMDRRGIGMVFQNFGLFPHLRVLENLSLAPQLVLRTDRKTAMADCHAMLERVGLGEKATAYPSELSGGQQQRVAIARALVLSPEVLLFDEPTSALDPELVNEVLTVIEELAAEGMTMVVVTHELSFARRVASTISMFDSGQIVEERPPDQFFGDDVHDRTRQFLRHLGT